MAERDELLIGIDIGTSSCKAVLFLADGTPIAGAKRDYPLSVLGDGMVEQDPDDYIRGVIGAVRELTDTHPELRERVAGIGLDGQVPTDIFLGADGKPLCPGISWQDTRAVREADELRRVFPEEKMRELVGSNVPVSAGWTASRLLWMRRNRPELVNRCRKVSLPKDYVGQFLTGGDAVSDGWSMKSTVHLLTGKPAGELLDYIGIGCDRMPEIRPWGALRGTLTEKSAELLGLSREVRVSCGCSDAPAAILGCGVLAAPGIAFDSCGTSEIVGLSGSVFADCPGLMTIPAEVTGSLPILYGPTQSGSGCLSWLAERLLEGKLSVAELCARVDPSAPVTSVLFRPYLAGERAPLWDPELRADFSGFGKEHGLTDFVRAILEGVGFSVRHCLHVATEGIRRQDPSFALTAMRLTGGGAKSPAWRQIKADICGITGELTACGESCALGAAMTAAVGLGLYADWQEASVNMVRVTERIFPNPEMSVAYDRKFQTYLER